MLTNPKCVQCELMADLILTIQESDAADDCEGRSSADAYNIGVRSCPLVVE
jgi:hypothetical protein